MPLYVLLVVRGQEDEKYEDSSDLGESVSMAGISEQHPVSDRTNLSCSVLRGCNGLTRAGVIVRPL